MKKPPLEDRVRHMVEGIYYSSEDHSMKWEPFENHSDEDVQEYVDNDTHYWLKFIEIIKQEVIDEYKSKNRQ